MILLSRSKVVNLNSTVVQNADWSNKTKQNKKSQQKQQNDRNAQTIQLRNHLLTFIYGGQTLGDAASFLEQNIQTRFLSGRREAVKLFTSLNVSLSGGFVMLTSVHLLTFLFRTKDARCPRSTCLTVKATNRTQAEEKNSPYAQQTPASVNF